jgi:heptosyltransferase-3
MSVDFDLPPKPKILVVTLRRLGDVLLTTPLVRTLRRGFPDAHLTMLVFRGSDRILKGNPDVDDVLTMAERPSLAETLAVTARVVRRYDLVVCTQAGDRPTFFSLLAGRRRIGLVPHEGSGAWWKRRAHHRAVAADPDGHRVEDLLRLADALGLARQPDLVCPQGSSAEGIPPAAPYAVLHANPMYRYKRWSDAGWRGLVRGLRERGLSVVATEGRDPAERAYVDALWDGTDVIRERGKLDWAGLTALLQGAAVYVGPDTSVTHLAAGNGCPTVAIYGATSPRLVGPWPVGGLAQPWDHAGTIQRRGNVWMVQNPLPCMPCERLGCERHLDSHSQCLEELSAEKVLAAVDEALALGRDRGAEPAGWRNPGKVGMQGGLAATKGPTQGP